MEYDISPRTIKLVQELYELGYAGSANIVHHYSSGAMAVLGNDYAVELSGFCKETLYITERLGSCSFIAVGRYNTEAELRLTDLLKPIDIIIDIAWNKYKTYKERAPELYGLPEEWKEVFIKKGLIRVEMRPTIIED